MSKKVIVNLNELLQQEGLSLRELSRLTDIRHAALSELANQKSLNIIRIKKSHRKMTFLMSVGGKTLVLIFDTNNISNIFNI